DLWVGSSRGCEGAEPPCKWRESPWPWQRPKGGLQPVPGSTKNGTEGRSNWNQPDDKAEHRGDPAAGGLLMSPWGALAAVLVRLLLVAGALLGLGWKASGHAMHPGAPAYPWAVGDFPNLDGKEVTVTSRTGVELAGRFFAGRSRATIILSHGYGGNRDEMLPVANSLHDAGFSVFSYDLPGCGGSGGQVTFGAKEAEDLRSVLDYLTTRP